MIKTLPLSCLICTALAMAVALPNLAVHAQTATVGTKPQIVYQYPQDGATLNQAPLAIQLCFASPINIKDLSKGGDFAFAVTEPDGIGIGNRAEFQTDGYGVAVYPANAVGSVAGQWKFHYRVTSPDAQSALEGDIGYTVDQIDSAIPRDTPRVCVKSGGTATPLPVANGSTTSTSGDDRTTLKYALLGIGLAGVFGLVSTLFIDRWRRRRANRRLTPGPTAPIDWAASRRMPSPTRNENPPPVPEPSPPPSFTTLPPVVQSAPPVPEPSPPSSFTTLPPVVQSAPPVPEPSPPPNIAPPPPIVQSPPSIPDTSPPPSSATPPSVVQSAPPVWEPSTQPSPIPPPVFERASPSAQSSRPTDPPTVPGDSDINGRPPDNSRYALLAIAAAVILLLGFIFRRRPRDKHGDDS